MVSKSLAVYAETASAAAEPRITETVGDAVVSWHPERGWLCSATGHTFQPCEHTIDLLPAKSDIWGQ